MKIQMYCSQDGNFLAELDGKWWKKKAPAEAYTIEDGGHVRPNNELRCTNPEHRGYRKIKYMKIRD